MFLRRRVACFTGIVLCTALCAVVCYPAGSIDFAFDHAYFVRF